MGLDNLRRSYEGGALTKFDYGARIQAEHARLADYSGYMKETDIASITISDDRVVMTSRGHGIHFDCNPIDKGIPPIVSLNFGAYEARDGALLLSLVDDGMNFFDIGANIGWYALHVGKLFPKARVFSFEPIPKSFEYLQRNIALNQLTNVAAFSHGLFNEPGQRTFHVDPQIMGAASSAESATSGEVPQICPVDTLDRVVERLGVTIDFIKADVEGAELFVFQGGLRSIAAMKPVIFAELLRKHARTFNYHPNQVIDLLSGLGYRCFTAGTDGIREFFVMDEQTIETNFVFLHGEKHQMKIEKLRTFTFNLSQPRRMGRAA